MKYSAIFLIRFYQRFFSRWVGPGQCRFYPTCSEYAALAIQKYGVVKGTAKAIERLSRCRPDNTESCIDWP
ncbi:MAG: membrane protein insertion efficiency factor YidD [Firmicutes bacterium]|nr:membrane protein insertion efficiency factor YidD [Bacillota bacterium]